MAVQGCCSLVAALFLSVYLSTTDAEGPAAAKPGVCPRNNLEVAVSEVCADPRSCSLDSDCPNDQKCCSSGCGHQCMPPYEDQAKPGVCPENNVDDAKLGVCAEMCSDDGDCPNDQKCCSNGCGHQCMALYKEKPGVCPSKNLTVGVCVESCSLDSDCPNDQKCCSNGCGHQCMPPYEDQAKPGVCPKNNVEDAKLGVCAEMCSCDVDCPNDQKCCSNGCGHQCMAPYKDQAKPGVCPKNNVEDAKLGVCAEMCSCDGDCPNDQKCCSNGCGHQCMPPYEAEPAKPGVCPKKLGMGLCVEKCSLDSDCPNVQKCCSTECGHQCMAPYEVRPGVGLKPNVR